MTKLSETVARNWGLKLLALILALVIYYSVRDSIHRRSGLTTTHAREHASPHPVNLSSEKTSTNVHINH